jgi:hypothetical protein
VFGRAILLLSSRASGIMADPAYKSAQEFLSKMESGLPDWNLREEVQKLSSELAAEVTEILLQRSPRKAYKSAQEFLSKMESGLPDWNLREEVQKLSPELGAEITEILLQLSERKPEKSRAARAPEGG